MKPSMNLAKAFQRLLPPSTLYVAEVLAKNADGTSTCELPGGIEIRARGHSIDVGNMAFVRNGVIEGPAPNLPVFTISI